MAARAFSTLANRLLQRRLAEQIAGSVVAAEVGRRNRAQSRSDRPESAKRLLWQPLAGPQSDAYYSLADELFYGGAAGGGKSDLLLGLAINEHRKSLILRREASQLRAIKERLREVLGSIGRFNENTGIWRGLPGNRLIELGGCPHLNDRTKFQGRPDDLKGFDELPEFLEDIYTFIVAWNRTAIVGQRTRIVNTGNPPTSALGEWVISRFGAWLDDQHSNPAIPGELRYYAQIDGKDTEFESADIIQHKGEEIQPRSRTFIPASVDDNPYYLATGYKAMLQNTPEPLRSQLLYGDFKVGLQDGEWQVIPTAWILEAMKRWTARVVKKDVQRLTAIGCDMARGGKASTVFAPIYDGNFVGNLDDTTFPGKDTPDGHAASRLFRNRFGDIGRGIDIFVDVIGVGGSFYDLIREHYQDMDTAGPEGERNAVYGINFGKRSKKRDKSGKFELYNLRAEAYWLFREMLDPNSGCDICLPPDNQLKADLCAVTYKIQAGRIICDDKDEIVARLGRSVDRGDAVVLGLMQSRAVALSSPSVVHLPSGVVRSSQSVVSNDPPVAPFDAEGQYIPPVRTAQDRMNARRRPR